MENNMNSNDHFEFSDEYIDNALDLLRQDLKALDEQRKHVKRAIRGIEQHIRVQRLATQQLEDQWAMPSFEEKR
jgi:hypothetical protein